MQTFTEDVNISISVNISADIEKYTIISGILEVSFMVSFKVSTHLITSPLFLSVYGRFKGALLTLSGIQLFYDSSQSGRKV